MYISVPTFALLISIAFAAPAPYPTLRNLPNSINLSELPIPTMYMPEISNTTYGQIHSTINATTTIPLSTSPISFTSSTSTAPAVLDSERAGVYFCPNINWGGHCIHTLTPLGSADTSCTQLTGQESSIGPDPGFYCEFYTLESDGSDFLGLYYPGVSDLRKTEKGDFNDSFYSFLCFTEEEGEAMRG